MTQKPAYSVQFRFCVNDLKIDIDLSSDDFLDDLKHPCSMAAIEWIQDDLVTLFTTDGLIQIGGTLIPRLSSSPSEVVITTFHCFMYPHKHLN